MNLIHNDRQTKLIQEYRNSKRKLLTRTKDAYCYEIRRFLLYLNKEPGDATYRDIERYLTDDVGTGRKRPLGDRAVNRILSSLRSFYFFLLREGTVQSNIVDIVERCKIGKRVPAYLKTEELNDLRKFCHGNILWRVIFELLYSTGIRRSELLGTNVSSLLLETRELKIMRKGGTEGYVRVPQSLISLLQQYLIWRTEEVKPKPKEQGLIVSLKGVRMSSNEISYIFRKMTKKTGVHVYPHKLRHTFGTLARQRGMSLEQIQKLLGHQQLATTEWYVHVEPETGEAYDKAFP